VAINRDLLYYAVRQQTAAGEPVVLRFSLPLETVTSVLWEFRKSLWFASVLILVILGGVTLLVSRSFTNRVERLTAFPGALPKAIFTRSPPGTQ